jgi:hypothetical protein
MTMKRAITFFLAAVFCFLFGILSHSFRDRKQTRIRLFPKEQPIKNQSGRQQCRPIYYGLGSGDGAYDPFCFDLQQQLADAAFAADVEKLKELLRAGANAGGFAGDYLYPLEAAASKGHFDAARLLLDNGADVNHWHPIRGTPLLYAVESGDLKTVELLLSRGADPYLVSGGVTPLSLVKKKNTPELTSLFESAVRKR